MKALSDTTSATLDRFADSLWLNDGLSRNTIESYRRDVAQVAQWLENTQGSSLLASNAADLHRHLAWQVETKRAKPRTTSRLVSSLKRFFQFALREGLRKDDPAAELDSPKLPRSLPKSLSEAEVEALLGTPDVETPQGLRDRAMIETLYASGLRVSELVGLKTVQVSLDMGVVRVLGKGAKERLSPLGEEAVAWIERLPARGAPLLLASRRSDSLFITARGGPMTRQAFWKLIQRHAQSRRHRAGDLAAHAAPRLRDAPHQPWRGPSRGPAPPRACGHLDHADLYPRRARAAEAAPPQAPPAGMIDISGLSPWFWVIAPLIVVAGYTVFVSPASARRPSRCPCSRTSCRSPTCSAHGDARHDFRRAPGDEGA
jgi:integrase/recombinase XerD